MPSLWLESCGFSWRKSRVRCNCFRYTYREPAFACESWQVMLIWVGSFGIGKASSPALSLFHRVEFSNVRNEP